MKRFRNRLHGLYADLGKRYMLNTVIQSFTPPIQQLNLKKNSFSLVFCFPIRLFLLLKAVAEQPVK